MVHTAIKKRINVENIRWGFNIPFAHIPPHLVRQLKHPITQVAYEPGAFYLLANWYDTQSGYWNIMGQVDGEVIVALWGTMDPLAGGLYVQHFTADKSVQRVGSALWDKVIEKLWELAEAYNLWFVWLITYKPKAMLRQAKRSNVLVNKVTTLAEVRNGRIDRR